MQFDKKPIDSIYAWKMLGNAVCIPLIWIALFGSQVNASVVDRRMPIGAYPTDLHWIFIEYYSMPSDISMFRI